ncbi:MAG: exonuclease domain-containing protein [Pseudomonadota bacterium]
MLKYLSLRLRIFLFFAFLGLGGLVLLGAGLAFGYRQLGDPDALSAFVTGGLIGGLAILALTTWIWVLFDEHVARPVERLAAAMRARSHAAVESDIDDGAAEYLGDLAPAASAVARSLADTRNALAEAVGRETARLGRETARLATLLAEVPEGVIFCGPDHCVVLYNGQARDVLRAPATLGLNRPIGDVLLPGPIMQAYDRMLSDTTPDGTDILVATRDDARLIEARMRLLRLDGQDGAAPGYLLALRDVSADLAVEAERANLLAQALDLADAALARAADPILQQRLAELRARKAPTDTQWWPMESIAAADLGDALIARLSRHDLALTHDLPATLVRCDGFAITRLVEHLARRWTAAGARSMSLGLAPDAGGVRLVLRATGDLPDQAVLDAWLDDPLSPKRSQFSGRDVLMSHASTITLDGGISLFLTTAARPALPTAAVEYDFDLLHAEVPDDLAAAPLRQLSFVVFDTETTGLDPNIDEVCQIAATRVVNGRCVNGEAFDTLVNPERPIPAASTAVHKISDAMVADAPLVPGALSQFHDYAGGAVLVAHNAPFDMAFLQRREGEIGKRFDQPILDTVLLSAIVFGQSADHTLDAVCQRLDVTIPAEERHTALGDARATAEAFARMIPMLEAADFTTLGATIREFDRHARLIAHLN